MTHEQKQFLLKILSQINLSVSDPNALKTFEMVQSIIKVLSE